MADFASRSFEQGFLPEHDTGFLTEFCHRFPLPPQLGSWQLVQPRSETILLGFSILRGQAISQPETTPPHGASGQTLPTTMGKILGSAPYKDPSNTWNVAGCSWPLLSPCGKVCHLLHARLLDRTSRKRFNSSDSLWNNADFETLAEQMQGKHC